MSKKEKFFWSLAYLTTLLLTLLPFFDVGLANTDDLQYYNTSHYPNVWVNDAIAYAHTAGRFYFILTKYFYYIPYLGDNYALTKFIQYFTVFVSYALFSYLVFRIFKTKRLGALTGLLLIFNMSMGIDRFYPPTSYPFYFHFSLIIFLLGILFYVNYDEKGGLWRVIVGAVLALTSCLFYENYVLFSVIFIGYVFIREWCRNGFVALWKSKDFYKRIVPFICAVAIYMACYIGYRIYVASHFENISQYGGSALSSNFSLSKFFEICCRYTIFTLPGRLYGFRHVQETLTTNSQLISGHYNNVWFVLTHAPAIAYVNVLIQCGMLWFLMKKATLKNLSWAKIIVGFFLALFVAFASNALVAVADKYNSDIYGMRVYVTSMYSYFGIVLALAILVTLSIKLIKNEKARSAALVVWCLLLAGFSLHHSYTNDLLSREWKKSQNRMTVMDLVAEEKQFDNIPDNSILYIESLLHTSKLGWSVCCNNYDFPNYIRRVSNKKYVFAVDWNDLLDEHARHPEAEVYFLQATETKKYGELLFAFSHITFLGEDLSSTLADNADVYYYSPTKNYVLFYGIKNASGDISYKASKVVSYDIHKKLTYKNIQNESLCPMEFRISNME